MFLYLSTFLMYSSAVLFDFNGTYNIKLWYFVVNVCDILDQAVN